MSAHIHVADRFVACEVEVDRNRPLLHVEFALDQGPFFEGGRFGRGSVGCIHHVRGGSGAAVFCNGG